MNYVVSFAMCLALTAIKTIRGDPDLYWLIVSDINVGVFLYIAWSLGQGDKGIRRVVLTVFIYIATSMLDHGLVKF